MDGFPGEQPPVVAVTEHFVNEDESLAMLKLLIRHGVDLDVMDEQEHSALFNAVVRRRVRTVELLVEHGIRCDESSSSWKSAVDWLRPKLERNLESGGGKHAKILTLLTGEEVTLPDMDLIAAEKHA